jgi:hypothetical protein
MFSEEIILGLIAFAQWMILIAKWFLITAIVCIMLAIVCYAIVMLSNARVRYKLLKAIRTISSI